MINPDDFNRTRKAEPTNWYEQVGKQGFYFVDWEDSGKLVFGLKGFEKCFHDYAIKEAKKAWKEAEPFSEKPLTDSFAALRNSLKESHDLAKLYYSTNRDLLPYLISKNIQSELWSNERDNDQQHTIEINNPITSNAFLAIAKKAFVGTEITSEQEKNLVRINIPKTSHKIAVEILERTRTTKALNLDLIGKGLAPSEPFVGAYTPAIIKQLLEEVSGFGASEPKEKGWVNSITLQTACFKKNAETFATWLRTYAASPSNPRHLINAKPTGSRIGHGNDIIITYDTMHAKEVGRNLELGRSRNTRHFKAVRQAFGL